jgi:undecaprenyl-diphosphatase
VDIFESLILGLVQGITEFIPVSSSGHLVLTQELFGQTADHLFIQALDFGTLLALVIFFWPRLVDLARQVFVERNFRLLRNLVLTALPVAVIGLALSRAIESNGFIKSPIVVSVMLAVVGLVMIVLEKLPKLSAKQDGADLTAGRAIGIGLAQVLALIPGVSRSGSTIIASRLAGLKPKAAAEYSFMVSIPIMCGLVLKLLAADYGYIAANWQPLLVGNLAALVAGLIAVKFMIGYLSRHSLAVFGWYRLAVAAIFAILLLT